MSLSKPKRAAIALAVGATIGTYAASAGFLWSISSHADWRLPALTVDAARDWAMLPATAYLEHREWAETRKDIARKMDWARGLGLTLAFVPPMFVILRRKPAPGHYGDARWPTEEEIEDAGLFAKTGFIVGEYGRRLVRLAGELGMLVIAPPGQGKGAGILEPNLLHLEKESVVVNDIKGDLWNKCSGWLRSKGYRVSKFSPMSRFTRRCNPLGYITDYTVDPAKCFGEIQAHATQLYPHVGGKDSFWQDHARNYHIGVTLSLFETPGTLRTLGEVLRRGMAQGHEGFRDHWLNLIAERDDTSMPFSSRLKQILFELVTLDQKTVGGIRAQWSARLSLWQNPIVDAATSPGRAGDVGDFDLRRLRRQRMAVFVEIQPPDIDNLKPLLNLFWELALGLQCRELPESSPDMKYRVELLMDEGPAVGFLPSLATYAAFLRQYWIRLGFIAQDEAQIEMIYGATVAKVLKGMLALRVVFPPQSMAEAKAISTELGTYTAMVATEHRNGGKVTTNYSPHPRPLLMDEQVLRLGPSKALVFYKEPGSPGAYGRESIRPFIVRRIYSFATDLKLRMFYAPPSVPEIAVVIDRPLAASPPRVRAVTAADAKDIDKMPLKRFIDPKQIPLPLVPPKTQAETNKFLDDYLTAQAA